MVELLPGQAPEVRLADVRAIVVTRSGKLLLAVDRD
jgi:hypothetical protein